MTDEDVLQDLFVGVTKMRRMNAEERLIASRFVLEDAQQESTGDLERDMAITLERYARYIDFLESLEENPPKVKPDYGGLAADFIMEKWHGK